MGRDDDSPASQFIQLSCVDAAATIRLNTVHSGNLGKGRVATEELMPLQRRAGSIIRSPGEVHDVRVQVARCRLRSQVREPAAVQGTLGAETRCTSTALYYPFLGATCAGASTSF